MVIAISYEGSKSVGPPGVTCEGPPGVGPPGVVNEVGFGFGFCRAVGFKTSGRVLGRGANFFRISKISLFTKDATTDGLKKMFVPEIKSESIFTPK